MEKKNILILGGEGFIGRNIAEFLSSEKYSCSSVGVEESIFSENRKDELKKINPYDCKIENDFDVAIHLIDNRAAEGEDFADAEKKLIENIGLKSKKHLILFSSAVIYANPDSEYGKRKIELERIFEKYCKEKQVKLTIFRLFNIYGPYHLPFRQGSLVANIFFNYLIDKKTEIHDMKAKRDFMYSKDMVKFIEYVIDNKVLGRFDLATNKSISIKELLEHMEEAVGEKINIIDRKNKEEIACPSAANELIDEVDLTPIEKGLADTFEFYQNNLEIIKKDINKQHGR